MNKENLKMFNETIKEVQMNIAVKPFCIFFGLDFQNQVERIKRDLVLNQLYGNFRIVALDNKERDMFCLSKRGFIRWIDRINPQNVDSTLRDKFIQFQIYVFDYMFGNFELEEKTKFNFLRLQKLKRPKGIISMEIAKCEENVKSYLSSKFIQTELDFYPTSIDQ